MARLGLEPPAFRPDLAIKREPPDSGKSLAQRELQVELWLSNLQIDDIEDGDSQIWDDLQSQVGTPTPR